MKTKMTFTKVNKEKRYNMIDPNMGDRMGDYEMMDAVKSKWENSKEGVDGCGNVNSDCLFDIQNKKIEWGRNFEGKNLRFAEIISSPLLLYRLICLFGGNPIIVEEPYKSIWWYNIKNKKSDKMLGFGEWKGAVGFWLPEYDYTKLTEEFKSELEELLLFLISDQIAHPYDNCTAGQVA